MSKHQTALATRTDTAVQQVKQKGGALQTSRPLNNQEIQKLSSQMETSEIRMIIAERDGRKLKSLNKEQLRDTVIDIMSEVKLLTGALIYDDPALMKTQVVVIQRFLYSGFWMLTKEEIIHAFYLNMEGKYEQVFRHYNKELNCEFMSDVLRSYLSYKLYVRETKGPQIKKLLGLGPKNTAKREVDHQFWKQIIQEEYFAYRTGQPSMQMWHARKYYTLRKFGLLPFPKGIRTWCYFFKKVMQDNTAGTRLPAGANIKHLYFESFAQCRALFNTDEDWSRCIDFVRRYAYWYVLRACSECGINNLWEEISGK